MRDITETARENLLFTASHTQSVDDGKHAVVFIDPKTLYKYWTRSTQVVIHPKDLTREAVEDFAHYPSWGFAIELPYVHVNKSADGLPESLEFHNGRHRAAFVAGLGVDEIPIEVDEVSKDAIMSWKGVRRATEEERQALLAPPPKATVFPVTLGPRKFDFCELELPVKEFPIDSKMYADQPGEKNNCNWIGRLRAALQASSGRSGVI